MFVEMRVMMRVKSFTGRFSKCTPSICTSGTCATSARRSAGTFTAHTSPNTLDCPSPTGSAPSRFTASNIAPACRGKLTTVNNACGDNSLRTASPNNAASNL